MEVNEAIERLRKLAQGEYFLLQAKHTYRPDSSIGSEYSAYIKGTGWMCMKHKSLEEMLEAMEQLLRFRSTDDSSVIGGEA